MDVLSLVDRWKLDTVQPGTSHLDATHVAALLVLIAFAMFYFRGRYVLTRATYESERFPALDRLRRLTDEAIEEGRPIHVSAGTGALGGPVTAETLAGLDLGRRLATKVAAGNVPTVGSSPDPTTYAALSAVTSTANAGASVPAPDVFVPDRGAYAMEVMGLVSGTTLGASVLAGSFGDEYLLLAHAGQTARVPQIVGSGSAGALPVVAATAEAPLLGEELFNAGPLLDQQEAHVASLLAQDGIRYFVVATMALLVLARTFGVL